MVLHIPPIVYPTTPVTNVQPFTFKDGDTFLERLERITQHINKVINPWLEENIDELTEDFKNQVNNLISAVNSLANAVINDGIDLQDEVLAGIVSRIDSESREILDTIYANKSYENRTADLETLTNTGRLSETELSAAFARGVSIAAKGATTSDDATSAIEAAYESAATFGASLYIPEGVYMHTGLTFDNAKVSIIGPGTLKGGTVNVGKDDPAWDAKATTIQGVTFEQTGSGDVLNLKNPKGLTIQGCHFKGGSAGIKIDPSQPYATMLRVDGNRFTDVDYALQSTSSWVTFADSYFTNNVIRNANVSAVALASIDGIHITGNTFFFPGYATEDAVKEKHIVIGRADWVIISDNNFFESGLESVDVTDCRHLTITGNNFAWCGQREMTDTIKISASGGFTSRVTIAGNNIEQFTNNGVGLYGAGTYTFEFGVNTATYSASNAYYYGSTELNTVMHYRLFVDTAVQSASIIDVHSPTLGEPDSIRGEVSQLRQPTGQWAASGSAVTAGKAVSNNSAVPLFRLGGLYGSTSSLSGMVLVTARDTASGKLASYLLMLSAQGSRDITVVSSTGLTTGAAADEPSFTFELSSTGSVDLRAVRGSSTVSSTFVFQITTWGNIVVRSAL